jgi:hypothetical protein
MDTNGDDVNPARPPPVGAMLCAGILTAQLVAGTTTRDALYFASLSVSSLPQIVIASAGFSILIVAVTGRVFRELVPTTFVPIALGLSAAAFIGEWVLARVAPCIFGNSIGWRLVGLERTPGVAP